MRYRAMFNVFLAAVLAAGVALVPVAAAHEGHDEDPDPTAAESVSVVDNEYLPDTVTVAAGTTVQWTVSTSALENHTVTADDGLFDSGELQAGQSFSRVFNIGGTFTYHCEVHPDEMSGTVVVAAATEATPPEAPTDVEATAGAGSATVTWSPPANDGGSAITGYTVTASDGTTAQAPAGATSATVEGLTTGTLYTFTVTATNAVGTSAASAPSTAVAPTASVPGAPTNVEATAGAGSATVTWSAPASNGGSTITSYIVTANPGDATATVSGTATSATVTGLDSGTSYTFTVTATNAVGTSSPSAPSNAVTPTGDGEGTAPGSPTNVAATAGDGSATVTWSAPASDGGSPITGYVVTANPGGATATVSGSATSATVTGLDNGTSYTFTVTATNAAGTGTPSAVSNAVTPSLIAAACPPEQVPDSTFTDIAGNVHAPSIECIVWYGITLGAAPGQYAPDVEVTRDQMASFIARMMESAGVTLEPASDRGFTDIAGNVHADRINQLAAVGVSLGSTPTTYAPDEVVPREQMATFLVRAYEVVSDDALTASRDYFTDDEGSVHEDNINKAAEAQFTSGTSATTFAPDQPVRRDQMGSFLARTLSALAEAGHGTTP